MGDYDRDDGVDQSTMKDKWIGPGLFHSLNRIIEDFSSGFRFLFRNQNTKGSFMFAGLLEQIFQQVKSALARRNDIYVTIIVDVCYGGADA